MATDLEQLVVQLSADVRGYENAMRKAVGVTNTQVKAIEGRYKAMSRNLSQSLSAPLAGLGAALSTREILKYADAWTQAGNLIRSAGQASGVQTRSLEELRKGADAARVSLESYAGLYANLIRSASGVAKSEAEIARATELVSKAMKAGGASTQEQQSAIQQLGQALTSGVLQGDELRSLRENAPVLAAAIAKEFETTVGGLKKLGEQGKLTADRVFKGILNYGPEIEAQFKQTNQTIAEGFVAISNALTQYIGTLAKSSGVTNAVNAVMGALAGNIDAVAKAAAAAGVVLLSRYAPILARVAASQALVIATNPFLIVAAAAAAATLAVTEFGDQIHPVAGDMANLQDYAGTIWDDIASGAKTAGSAVSDAFLGAINLITDSIGGIEVSWADVIEFTKGIINTQIGAFVAMYDVVVTTFTKLPGAVGEKIIDGINVVIKAIEDLANKAVDAINKVISGINNGPGVSLDLVDPVSLGRIKNQFAGAGAEAGDAYAAGIKEALGKDYIGDAFAKVKQQADIRALDRRSQARDARDSERPISSEGFGGALNSPSAASGGGGSKTKTKKDDLQKEIEQITKKTAALKAETEAQAGLNPLVNDYGYAVAKATALQDLETAAKEAGINVSAEQRAEMERLAEAYAQATVESAKLEEAQGRLKDRAEEWRSASQDASRGFIGDLIEGKSAADALANALQKVADKLLDIAVDDLFRPNTGVFGGIGGAGGIFGGRIIPGILHSGGTAGQDGYGHGRSYPASLWANAPRFHSGGEVPALLLPGERVLNRRETAAYNNRSSGRIQIDLGPDLEARFMDGAARQSVRISRSEGNQVRRDVPRLVTESQKRFS